jgi:type IV conjugative transfer system lipoprotein TraV
MLLSGCANMNAKFDCPLKAGILCRSLDDVNRMVDRGELGNKMSMKTDVPTLSNNSSYIQLNGESVSTTNIPSVIRQHESVLRIWIAPYVATDNNYYQSTWVYTVIKAGTWYEPAPVLK